MIRADPDTAACSARARAAATRKWGVTSIGIDLKRW